MNAPKTPPKPKAASSGTPNTRRKSGVMVREGIDENDVICGPGNYLNHGNTLLGKLSEEVLPAYFGKGTPRHEKEAIIEKLYNAIDEIGGQFKDSKTQKVLTKTEALAKIKGKLQRLNQRIKRAQKDPPKDAPKAAATASTASNTAPQLEAVPEPTIPFDYNTIVVARNRLLKGYMSEEHAKSLLEDIPFSNEQAKDQAAQVLLEQLQQEKEQLKTWAKYELMQAMVHHAYQVKLINPPHDSIASAFADVGLIWAKDTSQETHQKIHSVLYGTFQQEGKKPCPWITHKQAEYMRQQNMVYAPVNSNNNNNTSRQGYVYEIIAQQMNFLHNLVKGKGKKAHGKELGNSSGVGVFSPRVNSSSTTKEDENRKRSASEVVSDNNNKPIEKKKVKTEDGDSIRDDTEDAAKAAAKRKTDKKQSAKKTRATKKEAIKDTKTEDTTTTPPIPSAQTEATTTTITTTTTTAATSWEVHGREQDPLLEAQAYPSSSTEALSEQQQKELFEMPLPPSSHPIAQEDWSEQQPPIEGLRQRTSRASQGEQITNMVEEPHQTMMGDMLWEDKQKQLTDLLNSVLEETDWPFVGKIAAGFGLVWFLFRCIRV